jgi:hypothetical protein
MQRRLIIHAGFPKSGTTALQASFRENNQVLKASGIEYPETKNDAHHGAAAALVGRSIGWQSTKRDQSNWQEFVQSINDSTSDVVLISSEFLTAAGKKQIKRIKEDFAQFHIEIFFTLRPLNRIIPSIYQQNLKKGSIHSYPEWISKKFMTETGELRQTPRLINHAQVIENWAKVFGAENISLIIGDSRQPELLYRLTEKLLGISQLSQVHTRALNRSLTVRECEILRRVNASVNKKWSWYEYQKLVRQGYVKEITGTKSTSGESGFQTPQFLQDVISNFASNQIKVIEKLGVRVLGDIQQFCNTEQNQKDVVPLDEFQIAREFKIVMGHLNWRRRKYRLNPLAILRRIKNKVLSKSKRPARSAAGLSSGG